MRIRTHVRTCAAIGAVTGAVVTTAPSARAAAQQPAPGGGASITGVVFDSLVKNAPLAGAEVTIDGSTVATVTDGSGRFKLDGVSPGRVVVRFYHASLDSLGFGAAPVAAMVPDSGVVAVRLTTPSPSRLHARLCPGAQPASTGVIVGRVRNVDDRAPIGGATTTANWAEWSVGPTGLAKTDRTVSATATDAGAFALCGVPNDVEVVVRATGAGHITGLVEVDLARRPFVVRDFGVSVADHGSSLAAAARLDTALANGNSPQPEGSTTLQGTVRGANGRVLDQAQIGVFGFPISTRTGSEGTYALNGLPAGTQTVDVRAIGFARRRLTVDLHTGERRTLDITLPTADAQTLAQVNIVGHGTSLDRSGFEDRRKAGTGRYITADEIKRRGVFDMTHALWNVSGTRVVWDGHDNVVMFTRPIGTGKPMTGKSITQGGGESYGSYGTLCYPAYWVDGFAMPSGEDVDANTFARPGDIRGIEVYLDPSAVPLQYRRADVGCGVVLIWTKPPRPKRLDQRRR